MTHRTLPRAAAALLLLGAGAAEAQGGLRLGVLPASVLRNESTLIAHSLVPDFSPHGWAGLVCGPARCELRPIRLERRDTSESRDSADKLEIVYAKAGRRAPIKGESTLVLLQGLAPAAGAIVPTWFTLRSLRVPQDAASGSMGVTIVGPGRGTWQLVPRWNPKGTDSFVNFYLETRPPGGEARRQLLGRIAMDALERGVSPKDLLIWAGDLDGDGRIDLITRTGPKSAQPGLRLWLSSRATGDQMVGPAAELSEWADVEEAEGC
jgi:hypothetical protein